MRSGRCPRSMTMPARRSFPAAPTGSSITYWYPFLPFAPTRAPRRVVRRITSGHPRSSASSTWRSQDQLDELAGQIEAARKEFPDWTAGDVLLALVRCRAGGMTRPERWSPGFSTTSRRTRSPRLRPTDCTLAWALGLELEKHAATRDLALTVYERSLDDPYAFSHFVFSPIRFPLGGWLISTPRDGRSEDARAALLRLVRHHRVSPRAMLEHVIKRYRMACFAGASPASWSSSDSRATPCPSFRRRSRSPTIPTLPARRAQNRAEQSPPPAPR